MYTRGMRPIHRSIMALAALGLLGCPTEGPPKKTAEAKPEPAEAAKDNGTPTAAKVEEEPAAKTPVPKEESKDDAKGEGPTGC